MSNAVLVSTTINGDTVEFACPADEVLLDSLRDRVGLTGVKEGCGTGDCGACSVTLDGELVCSCLVLGVEADGRAIGTVEGLTENGDLHPLQQNFIVAGNLCRCTGYDKIVRAVQASAKDLRKAKKR
jgi:carbon-monoxide dehydrogenase small subunit